MEKKYEVLIEIITKYIELLEYIGENPNNDELITLFKNFEKTLDDLQLLIFIKNLINIYN